MKNNIINYKTMQKNSNTKIMRNNSNMKIHINKTKVLDMYLYNQIEFKILCVYLFEILIFI